MPRSKPPYPAELRQRILDLVRAGRTPASLAPEFEPLLEISQSTKAALRKLGAVRARGRCLGPRPIRKCSDQLAFALGLRERISTDLRMLTSSTSRPARYLCKTLEISV
jgi:hypothetical protein